MSTDWSKLASTFAMDAGNSQYDGLVKEYQRKVDELEALPNLTQTQQSDLVRLRQRLREYEMLAGGRKSY